MKISKQYLKQVIKEELSKTLKEVAISPEEWRKNRDAAFDDIERMNSANMVTVTVEKEDCPLCDGRGQIAGFYCPLAAEVKDGKGYFDHPTNGKGGKIFVNSYVLGRLNELKNNLLKYFKVRSLQGLPDSEINELHAEAKRGARAIDAGKPLPAITRSAPTTGQQPDKPDTDTFDPKDPANNPGLYGWGEE